MTDTLSFRPLDMANEQEIIELYKEYYPGADFHPGYFEEYLNGHPAVGMYNGGQLAGFCLSRKFAPDILEIAELYVAISMRNRSLGQGLVEQMHTTARQQNYKAMILSNSMLWAPKETKQSATRFYEKLGYQKVFATDKTNIWCFTL